jgi:opacity protein-like surface antigen
MRRLSVIFMILLGLTWAGRAEAQSTSAKAASDKLSDLPRWDVAGSASLFWAKPGASDTLYQDDWYFNGRYAAAIGQYWTEHLKTEVEYAASGESSTFSQGFRNVAGVAGSFPVPIETLHRLEQGSVRMLWQFGSNAWVHPYVSGGLVVERERKRIHVPPQFQFTSGREPVLIVPESTSDPAFEYRLGFTAGAGAKVYMTENAFFNTGIVGTFSNPVRTFSLHAGFGIDF